MSEKTIENLDDPEQYMAAIIESSLDGIVVVDEHGRFEFCNDSFVNIVGWPKQELIGEYFDKILPEDMKELALREWNEVHKGISNEFEITVITKSRELKYVIVAHTIREIKGQNKVISIVKDITKHRELESKIEESEQKYREIFENALEAIYTASPEGRFLTMNQTGIKIFGSTQEEIIGSHFTDWLVPDCMEIAVENLKKLLSGQYVEQPVIREIIRKNGEHRMIMLKVRIIKDGDMITGIHGVFNDVTEKRDMELQLRYYNEKLRMAYEKLKIAEAKYRDLFENASDVIFTVDDDGYIHNINKVGLELINDTVDEVMGTHFTKWLTPQSSELARETFKKLRLGEPVELPIMVEVCSANGPVSLEVNGRLMKDVDKVIGFHGIARVITGKANNIKKYI